MTCGECRFYMTDEDEGKLIEHFRYCTDENAFCLIKNLFTIVNKNDSACPDFLPQFPKK